MYKKKSLKFTYEQISRDTRHAESLKARESSRFERLSMLRSINDSDSLCDEKSMETAKPVEYEGHKREKQPMSRLEMLFKWKQEKQLKKEMEMKKQKKPFYVGGSTIVTSLSKDKNLQTVKSSFIAQPNTSFNTSKAIKSKLCAPSNSVQPNKVPNPSKQLSLSTTFQPSRIPNSKQVNSVAKSVNTLSKGTPTFPKKPPKAVSHLAASRVNQTGSVSKTVKNTEKAPLVKSSANNVKVAKASGSYKPINQGSSQLKSLSKLPSRPIQKAGMAVTKPASSVIPVSKGIPVQKVQSKLPVTSVNQKSAAAPILQQKETCPSIKNVTTRKGYCFKKAVTDSRKQQTGILKKIPSQDAIKKPDEKTKKDIEVKCTEIESLPEQSLENIPDLFDSSISIIKTSFAPSNFRFEPPPELSGFTFDDDDDPIEALRQVKLEFMSRTSTPSKPSGRNSSTKNSKASPCDDSPLMNTNKSPQKSFDESTNSNVAISDLLSPNSLLQDKIVVNKETNNELVDQESCEKVACDIASKIETTDRVCDELLKSSFNEKELFGDSIENKNAKEKSVSLKIDSCESQPPVSVKNEDSQNTFDRENISFDDSLLDTVDLNEIKNMVEEKIQLMKLEDEEVSKADDSEELEILNYVERKPNGAIPKRISMLKSVSTLNAIAETDECIVLCPASKVKQDVATPRRSRRISSRQHLDILSDCEEKTDLNSPLSSVVTPRRSLRLQKMAASKFQHEDDPILSPFGEKINPKVIQRRSMRLIDLNTPEKDGAEQNSKTNLTTDFANLRLDSENMDPNLALIDFESPDDVVSKLKSKKVSLLYTPEKTRKSLRKSIRGDLMAFSPVS